MESTQNKSFKRSFAGKTNDFKNNQERNFEKAHLKAYLNGNKWFRYGQFDQRGEPIYFPVAERWIEIKEVA